MEPALSKRSKECVFVLSGVQLEGTVHREEGEEQSQILHQAGTQRARLRVGEQVSKE